MLGMKTSYLALGVSKDGRRKSCSSETLKRTEKDLLFLSLFYFSFLACYENLADGYQMRRVHAEES